MTGPLPTPEDLGRFTNLLDAQFWLMGRDVEHPDGNLLCRLGFERQRSPRRLTRAFPSRYRRPEPDGEVIIWRCGLLLSTHAERLLVLRGLRPVTVGDEHRPEQIYDPELAFALRSGCPASDAEGLRRAARWFAAYEVAVAGTTGVAHRIPPGRSRPTLAPRDACSLEHRWRVYADGQPSRAAHG